MSAPSVLGQVLEGKAVEATPRKWEYTTASVIVRDEVSGEYFKVTVDSLTFDQVEALGLDGTLRT